MKSVTAPSPNRSLATLLSAVMLAGACADDPAASVGRVDAGVGGMDTREIDAPFEGPTDVNVPLDLGPPPTEPPLTVPTCPTAGNAGASCCASALGFEDGSTSHFLPPACCRMALSKPQVSSMPTACGGWALRLDADFQATDASSLCDQPDQAPSCAFREGEVSRGVLAALDLTALTVSAMVYLDGPALPAAPVSAKLFVLGRGGLIEGTAQALPRIGVWTRIDLRIADDGTFPGADIRVIGVRIAFHGQAWTGRAYIDEITWR